MPQNEHKKVLKELTEAYDAVYSEGLPGQDAAPLPPTANHPDSPYNKPPQSTDSRQSFKDAYASWYHEFDTDMRYGGNDPGPAPDPAEYGLSEAEAEQVKEEHRKERLAEMYAIMDKARQSR